MLAKYNYNAFIIAGMSENEDTVYYTMSKEESDVLVPTAACGPLASEGKKKGGKDGRRVLVRGWSTKGRPTSSPSTTYSR